MMTSVTINLMILISGCHLSTMIRLKLETQFKPNRHQPTVFHFSLILVTLMRRRKRWFHKFRLKFKKKKSNKKKKEINY